MSSTEYSQISIVTLYPYNTNNYSIPNDAVILDIIPMNNGQSLNIYYKSSTYTRASSGTRILVLVEVGMQLFKEPAIYLGNYMLQGRLWFLFDQVTAYEIKL